MLSYIIKRTLYGILVVFLVVIIISSIIYLAPVDPTRLSFGQRSDVETVEAKKKQFGLDQSLSVQLGFYLRDISPISMVSNELWDTGVYQGRKIVPGESKSLVLKKPYLRESYQSGRSVSSILAEAIPKTVLLAISAFIIALIIGLLLGIIAAIYKGTFLDDFLIGFSVLGYSVPSYVSAIIFALVFGYLLHHITGLNVQGSIVELNELGDEVFVPKNLILPAIALGIRPLAVLTQLARSAMLDVLSQNYIQTAKSKGLEFTKIIRRHALKNALTPVVTAVSGWFAALLAGAFFVENVFNYKGLGELTVTALINFDIPVVLGAVLFTAIVFVVINLLVDILYVFIDPRIKLT